MCIGSFREATPTRTVSIERGSMSQNVCAETAEDDHSRRRPEHIRPQRPTWWSLQGRRYVLIAQELAVGRVVSDKTSMWRILTGNIQKVNLNIVSRR